MLLRPPPSTLFPTRRSSDLGTLQLAMEHTKQTIHNANVLIIGFGRIGITIARLFNQIGAKDRKSTRLNSSHVAISYAVFCLTKKKYELCQCSTHGTPAEILS